MPKHGDGEPFMPRRSWTIVAPPSPVAGRPLRGQPALAERRPTWREQAIAAARRAEQARPEALRADLAARLHTLTDLVVEPAAVYIDDEARTATVTVDGVTFRLAGQTLALRRPCAYCGTGQFTSPAIDSLADLGYALDGWRPLHDDCGPLDPDESISL
jgi:hypothetical protein